jgi:hypothetical protein
MKTESAIKMQGFQRWHTKPMVEIASDPLMAFGYCDGEHEP